MTERDNNTERDNSKGDTVSISIEDIDIESLVLGKSLRLGEDETLIRFDRLHHQQTLLTKLLHSAKSHIVLYGNSIDTALWSALPVTAALRAALDQNRNLKVQFLVKNSKELVQSGQHLLELLRSHMPAVECRIRRYRAGGLESDYVIVDRVGYLYVPNAARRNGTASFKSHDTAEHLLSEVEQEWPLALPDPDFRPVFI